MGYLVVIEGTDCSGKETQTLLLKERLLKDNIKVERLSFPMYDTPTGKIIGACLLGKPQMVSELLKGDTGFFEEGAGNIDALTAIDLYALDRRYNLPKIKKALSENDIVLVDRYVVSNMACRGGAILDKEERLKLYEKIKLKEYVINEIPMPDMTILLYMPYKYSSLLRKKRSELPDEVERDSNYLINSENAYLELADLDNFDVIDCVDNGNIKSINSINDEIYLKVKRFVK